MAAWRYKISLLYLPRPCNILYLQLWLFIPKVLKNAPMNIYPLRKCTWHGVVPKNLQKFKFLNTPSENVIIGGWGWGRGGVGGVNSKWTNPDVFVYVSLPHSCCTHTYNRIAFTIKFTKVISKVGTIILSNVWLKYPPLSCADEHLTRGPFLSINLK